VLVVPWGTMTGRIPPGHIDFPDSGRSGAVTRYLYDGSMEGGDFAVVTAHAPTLGTDSDVQP